MQKLILLIVTAVFGFGHLTPALADVFRLVNQSGTYLASVPYEVRKAGARVSWGATDALGRFVVNSDPGTYDLVVRPPGGETTKTITLDGRDNLKGVTIP
jgi:hypothetical protein